MNVGSNQNKWHGTRHGIRAVEKRKVLANGHEPVVQQITQERGYQNNGRPVILLFCFSVFIILLSNSNSFDSKIELIFFQ